MTDTRPAPTPTYLHARWNFIVILLDVAFFVTGLSFLDPVAVLPVLVGKLNGSEITVGAMGAIQRAGWIVPQLLGVSFVLHRPRKKPFILWCAAFSRLPFLGLAAAFWFVTPGSHIQALLYLLIGVFAIFFFADGLSGPAWHDIIARTIPPTVRGRFFGSINVLGGLMAIGAGALVRRLLSDPSLPFPHNYARLLALLCGCMAFSTVFLALMKDPPGAAVDEPHSPLRIARAIPATLRRNRLLRRIIISQNLIGFGALVIPFYAVYAHSRLGLPESMGGIFIWAGVAGSTGSSVVWAVLNDRKGPLTVIRGTAVMGLFTPLAAILIPLLVRAYGRPSDINYAYCAVFFLNGLAMSGGWMGITNYVFEIAPTEIRPLFLGLSSTLSSPVVLWPLVGGWLLTVISYPTLFAIAAAGAIVAGVYSFTLERPQPDAHETIAGLGATPSPLGHPTLD
jgi:MFS family permease